MTQYLDKVTLYVNTIEFDGRKAVINSYSKEFPILYSRRDAQREYWAAMYPNATVRTEEMTRADCVRLFSDNLPPLRSLAHEIGEASRA